MRIGELSRELGVTAHAVRFYERAGWLPRPERSQNGYREYRDSDLDHLRLLVDLRRMDVPLDSAARMATWCHSGHCERTTSALPGELAERRVDIADRIGRLLELDAKLAELQGHLAAEVRELPLVVGAGPCCSSVASIEAVNAGCTCCLSPAPDPL